MRTMIKSHSHTSQNGIALVYVLLIVFLITAIAITISIVVINELRLTRTASDATLAYYAAESGIERGLYMVKQLRADGTETLQSAVTVIQGLSGSLTNNTRYDNNESSAQSAIIQNQFIAEDRFVQADYYDFEDPLDNIPPANQITQSLVVSNAGNDPFSWAEVSWVAWDANGTLGESASARKIIGPTDLANGWTIPNLDTFDSIDPRGYRIRIKALFGDLSSITVTPYDQPNGAAGGGAIVDLPSLLQIKSVGQKSSFKQALTATIPWKIPLYGLYDYVLFSEGELLKDIILNSPTYSSGDQSIEDAIPAGAGNLCSTFNDCINLGWQALTGSNTMFCAGDDAYFTARHQPGTCYLGRDAGARTFTLPIDTSVVAGDGYYISLRMWYMCTDGDANDVCDTAGNQRDLAVEISGQSIIVDDKALNTDEQWVSCTIPDTYIIGNSTLPSGDPSRSIIFSTHQGNWMPGDWIGIDWYQISTFKLFPDCY